MFTQWPQVESRIEALLEMVLSLRKERDKLAGEVESLKKKIASYEEERTEAHERLDGLISELEKVEEACRG